MGFDWKVGIFILQFISISVSLITFFVIKFNDFKHLGSAVTEIKENQKEIYKNLDDLNKKVAKIEGVLSQ